MSLIPALFSRSSRTASATEEFILEGRPKRTPRALARSRPSAVRSSICVLSYDARHAKISKINLPTEVPVSICCRIETNCTCRSRSVSRMSRQWFKGRPSLSMEYTTTVSNFRANASSSNRLSAKRSSLHRKKAAAIATINADHATLKHIFSIARYEDRGAQVREDASSL
jgi:hypothetical protein